MLKKPNHHQVNFEVACCIIFSLLGIITMNEYAIVNSHYLPQVAVCLGASICMGYYALNDSGII